jgi:hypothetical protein
MRRTCDGHARARNWKPERELKPKPAHHALHLRRTIMSRKLALGLVAAASLGAMALAPSAASAHGWGGHHHHHFGHFGHHYGHGFGVAYIGGYDEGCYVVRRVPTPFGFRLRTINVCD